ncbi:PPC domain-containing protein [candidate division KSB1 bacterium]|nr:PPC domain-containing protein [candidate division KSB1 bacterium]
MRRYIFPLFMVMIIGLSSGCGGDKGERSETITKTQEAEPNNDRIQAMSVLDGGVYEGLINEKLDQDWYRISVPPDTSYLLRSELTGISDINLKMELFDSEAELLTEVNKNKEGEGEVITNYMLQPGDYFIRVRELWLKSQEKKFNDSLSYNLTVHLDEVTADAEQEANNKGILATLLQPDVAMKGYISPYQDIDWYKLVLPEQENTYIEISLSGIENVDLKLKVYDPIEALIKEVDHGGRGEGEKLTNLGVDQLREFYYVVVEGGQWQTNEDSVYTLNVKFVDVSHKVEFEPNDRSVRATNLVSADSICGFIDTGNDVDWYRIIKDEERTQVGRIELSGVPKVDLKMTITNEFEEVILSVDERGEMEGEVLANIGLHQRQNYYLKIESNKKGANTKEQYTLHLAIDNYFGGEELELNNEPEDANSIEVERMIQGYIHPVGDIDFYRLEISERHLGNLQILLSGIMKVNTDMKLYDADMNELGHAAAQREEGVERLIFEGLPGLYYIRVYDNDGKESNYRDKYQLAIFRQ